jgi:beta-1,4-mannosyl-glycoprotein beta-1,4-N-acetylglucosaminyltransferase
MSQDIAICAKLSADMIYDCFLFMNEFKVLELRLEELSDVVDKFVLVEATRTFSGNPKPLYFQENQERFSKYLHKIRHVVVDDMPPNPQSAWDVEEHQRNAILRGLQDAQPDDIIIISDVDEIPRSTVVSSFVGDFAALEVEDFYYKLNCKNLSIKTIAPVLVRRRTLTNPQEVRRRARHYWEHATPILRSAGWHFSCMQDAARLSLKLESFAHQEYNKTEFTDPADIAVRIRFGLDFVNRRDHYWCCVPLDDSFPKYLLKHQDRFQDLLFDFNKFHVDRLRFLYSLQDQLQERTALAEVREGKLVEAKSQINELSGLLSKATRWKRLVAGYAVLPAAWLVGAMVTVSELICRALRKLAKRPAPLVPPRDPSRCSIVIVTWEGKDLLAESLPPLLSAVRSQGGDHEILVVDNGSTDGTEEYLREHFPEVRVVRSEKNLYFGGGNNLGVRNANNDIVVLLNNDMIVHEDFLQPLLSGFHSRDTFAVASQVFLADPSKRREETGKTRIAFRGGDLDWRHETIVPSDENQKYIPVLWGHGGAVALDREKFLWLQGFDPLFDPFYVEDADLSYSAWKVGWQCVLATESKVVHKHRSSTSRFGHQFIGQIVRRNQLLFLWKNFGDVGKLFVHFFCLPRILVRRAGTPGIGIRLEVLAFAGAAKRLAIVLKRKLWLARSVVRTDEEILGITNPPAQEAIRASRIDFVGGPYSEQLGAGWYGVELAGPRPYRWMGKQASVFLLVPPVPSDLSLQGYVPPLSSYTSPNLVLTVSCWGQLKQFQMKQGLFDLRWSISEVPAGFPLQVQLSVNQQLESKEDPRELGLLIYSIGLVPKNATAVETTEVKPSLSPVSMSVTGPTRTSLGNANEKRILMICAYLPCLGTHGGGNMMFNLIRTLSQKHRLTVLSFYEQESELDQVPALSQYCEKLDVIYRGQNFDVNDVFGVKPREITREFYHRRMERLIRQHLATQKFDLIQCEYLQTAHFSNVAPDLPAVLTNHEVLSLSYEKRYKQLSWINPGKLKAMIALMRMLNYEEQVLRRFSAVVVLTEAEKKFLSRYAPHVPIHCHPMGVDCRYFSPAGDVSAEQSVVFIGNFRHSPNVHGASWLLEKVWPHIRQRCPESRLYLVGANPTPGLLKRDGGEGVTVTGWVEDVRTYLAKASVVVAPLFQGAGMRTKVLEAWAMAKAVVATGVAVEGLATPGSDFCVIADKEEEFAHQVCELLENRQLAGNIGREARRCVEENFSWEAFAELYDGIYEQAADAKHASPGVQPSTHPSDVDTVTSTRKLQER